MPLIDSWDEDSKKVYLEWIRSPDTTLAQKKMAAEYWSVLLNDILIDGPVGLTQCKEVTTVDRRVIKVYCLSDRIGVGMCFGVDQTHLHLVLMGSCRSQDIWDIACFRIKRWTLS